jgi:hypothetical protein
MSTNTTHPNSPDYLDPCGDTECDGCGLPFRFDWMDHEDYDENGLDCRKPTECALCEHGIDPDLGIVGTYRGALPKAPTLRDVLDGAHECDVRDVAECISEREIRCGEWAFELTPAARRARIRKLMTERHTLGRDDREMARGEIIDHAAALRKV